MNIFRQLQPTDTACELILQLYALFVDYCIIQIITCIILYFLYLRLKYMCTHNKNTHTHTHI